MKDTLTVAPPAARATRSTHVLAALAALASLTTHGGPCRADGGLDADAIVARVVDADPLALGGAEVDAVMNVAEPGGRARTLRFEARSRRHDPPLSKSVLAFRAPADVVGMKFLQVQRKSQDDERFLYTPELGRARRIAASTRSESFMGTDFAYADLDSRDLRESKAKRLRDESCGDKDCYRLDVRPTGESAVYARIELWVRKDNFIPVAWSLYAKGDDATPTKKLVVREMSRVGGRWFVTRSTMTNVRTGRSSELVLEKVAPRDDIPMDVFAVRALERG